VALFLVAGIIRILIGAALKTVAEEDQNLCRASHEVMVAELMVLALAVLAGGSLQLASWAAGRLRLS
jgi:hypothetical protein